MKRNDQVPGHWQIGAEVVNDPEKERALTQDILDNVRVVNVDVGNLRNVMNLISIQK